MSDPAAATPNQLLDWTCTQYDQTYSLSGNATVSRTNVVQQVDQYAGRRLRLERRLDGRDVSARRSAC